MHDTMVQPLTLGELWRELWRELYNDLTRLAQTRTRRLPLGCSLTTNDLVHDKFLRLHKGDRHAWTSRDHFWLTRPGPCAIS